MDTSSRADDVLFGLRVPVIERLLRAAPPVRQRLFAIACARLAGSIAELHWDEKLLPLMKQTFGAAELLLAGVDPQDPRIVEARTAAVALAHELDEIQLQFHGRIMEDSESGRYTSDEHPLNGAYRDASHRYAAADAAAFTLHEDPLTAAALCLEVADRAMRIDYDTLLILARHWLREPTDPIEGDPVWPLFKRFPDE